MTTRKNEIVDNRKRPQSVSTGASDGIPARQTDGQDKIQRHREADSTLSHSGTSCEERKGERRDH
jgi:hypothetical protein